jgi:hypothetical protein
MKLSFHLLTAAVLIAPVASLTIRDGLNPAIASFEVAARAPQIAWKSGINPDSELWLNCPMSVHS